jgi:hypothetical protein
MAALDIIQLRALADELGFSPATTDPEDIEAHRQHNKNGDYWLTRSHRFDHLNRVREGGENEH